MDEQKVQDAPASSADKSGMPAWGWIAIIVLVAVVVALLMLRQSPQPLGEGAQPGGGTLPGQTGTVPGQAPSSGVPAGPTQVPAASGSAQSVSQPINFDNEVKGLDQDANSVSENNFNESDLSDANVGL